MQYNKSQLTKIAHSYGFVRDTYEKVIRLQAVLDFLHHHDYLKNHLVLKGGTAINMVLLDVPRLSVDIDLDFIPNVNLEEMLEHRRRIREIILDYMMENGYHYSNASKMTHSLDSHIMQYQNAGGNRDHIKIEINFSNRAHIFEPQLIKSRHGMTEEDIEFLLVAPLEIYASKITALMTRAAARDLYDVNVMIQRKMFAEEDLMLLRKCVVFYHSISLKRQEHCFSLDAIEKITFQKIKRDLFPVLRQRGHYDINEEKNIALTFLKDLLRLTGDERLYLARFMNNEYCPELLFQDSQIIGRIQNHPMAFWKIKQLAAHV